MQFFRQEQFRMKKYISIQHIITLIYFWEKGPQNQVAHFIFDTEIKKTLKF